MTNPLLGKITTPAERASGCFLAYSFRNAYEVVLDGGTLNNNPIVNRGVILNGTDQSIKYSLNGEFYQKDPLSFHVIFNPSFAFDDGNNRYIFDSLATLDYAVRKSALPQLIFYAGGVAVFAIDVTAQWIQNGRNVLTVSSTSGATDAWLNGVQVENADVTAWTPTVITQLHVGQRSNASDRFGGKISLLHFYNTLLSQVDHENLWYSGKY